MKFLLDQDVYALTERFLREQGYDVVTASQLGLSRASDSGLLKTASEQGRIFITRDRDYGNLVFVHSAGSGVIPHSVTNCGFLEGGKPQFVTVGIIYICGCCHPRSKMSTPS
jgi:predicted nuclease of predicted toxin-antitoxin system